MSEACDICGQYNHSTMVHRHLMPAPSEKKLNRGADADAVIVPGGTPRFISIHRYDRGKCMPLYGGVGVQRSMYYGVCKVMGCKNCLAVHVPGHKDAEDREVAAQGLEANGWRRSEFDRKWLCDRHA